MWAIDITSDWSYEKTQYCTSAVLNGPMEKNENLKVMVVSLYRPRSAYYTSLHTFDL